jgi:uncharacterized membrane protein YkoI
MKNSMKLLVLGLTVVVAISVGAVYAADTTKPATKSTTAPVTATVKVKLSQADVTKIVVAAYKDAKVLDVQLNQNTYTVKISTAKGNRTLLIGGNSGKILKDTADVAPVATPVAKTTPAAKSK